MSPLAPALLVGLSTAFATPVTPRLVPAEPATAPDEQGWLNRHRLLLCLLAGMGAWLFVGGDVGAVAAFLASGGCWVLITRAEPIAERRRREARARDLPQLVRLVGIALEAGSAPAEAIGIATEAMRSGLDDRLNGVLARLKLGADPRDAWAQLASDAALAPLGRTLARAHDSGASVAVAIRRLADELADRERSAAEERARAVGVKAAVPLGLCLMPAFLLIGVVPLVGGLVSGLTW